MKICIPTESAEWFESMTCSHFGTAPFFTFVDTATDAYCAVANPGCHTRRGSCHHVPLLTAHDVEAIVCTGIGTHALTALRAAGIEVLAAPAGTVTGVVASVRRGIVRPLPVHQACDGNHGHGHCGHRHD